jgi:hypothetical protein
MLPSVDQGLCSWAIISTTRPKSFRWLRKSQLTRYASPDIQHIFLRNAIVPLRGLTPEVWDRIKRTVPTSMINSCKLWPAVTAFSFTFIDPQYRSIFAGFIAIGWQTYLSYLNRKAEIAEAAERALTSSSGSGGKREAARQENTQKIEA